MKTNKALKRLTKIEALMEDLTERYSAGASHLEEALQHAKAAVIRAKDAVSLHLSAAAKAAVVAANVARGAKRTAPAGKSASRKAAAKAPVLKTAKKNAPIKKRTKKTVDKSEKKSVATKKAAKKTTATKKAPASGGPATQETGAQ